MLKSAVALVLCIGAGGSEQLAHDEWGGSSSLFRKAFSASRKWCGITAAVFRDATQKETIDESGQMRYVKLKSVFGWEAEACALWTRRLAMNPHLLGKNARNKDYNNLSNTIRGPGSWNRSENPYAPPSRSIQHL